MPFDTGSLQASIEGYVGPYLVPLAVIAGIAIAVWFVLAYRALLVHNETEAAQLDRLVKYQQKQKSATRP